MADASTPAEMEQTLLYSSPTTPLSLLTALVIDTETTSIDPREARLVQIGAVGLLKGQIDEKDIFAELVNPQMSVPETSSRIHGLTTADVADAPTFSELLPRLESFLADRLLIGYAIDFDMAVLKREYALNRHRWIEPRTLDVRPLARAIGSIMPDYSLDAIAAALNVRISGRHTAMGDARATAEIFLKLVPLLKQRGVRTLAEAQEYSRQGDFDGVARLATRPERGVASRIDSFPYRHRAADVMSTPPLIMPPSLTLREVLSIMMKHKVSSVFIEPENGADAFGIVTERDVLRMLERQSEGALKLKSGMVASKPLHSVREGDFLYRALGRMNRLRIRHLAVTDKNGKIVGALSARDLLRQRAGDLIQLGDALDQSSTVEELNDAWSRLPLLVRSLTAEMIDPREITAVISHELCNVTRRAAELAMAELAQEQPSPGHLRFAVMVLGSGGRGESLLALDQDNAIVFDADGAEADADRWLEKLGQRLNDMLHDIGVPLCKGGVMARNPKWRKSAAAWRAQLADWLSRTDPDDILYADIFFDALPVFGDDLLAEELLKDSLAAAAQSSGFLKFMSMNAVPADTVLGWFGRLRTDEQGRIDLKANGIMPIFSAARVLALKHEIYERSTAARFTAVRSMPGMAEASIDHLSEAHRLLLGCILEQQLRDIEQGLKPSNKVAVSELTLYERERIRWALEQVQSMAGLLGDPLR
jgi:DNA polymerase-3 subunit epsilon/CBS domain-containing protein